MKTVYSGDKLDRDMIPFGADSVLFMAKLTDGASVPMYLVTGDPFNELREYMFGLPESVREMLFQNAMERFAGDRRTASTDGLDCVFLMKGVPLDTIRVLADRRPQTGKTAEELLGKPMVVNPNLPAKPAYDFSLGNPNLAADIAADIKNSGPIHKIEVFDGAPAAPNQQTAEIKHEEPELAMIPETDLGVVTYYLSKEHPRFAVISKAREISGAIDVAEIMQKHCTCPGSQVTTVWTRVNRKAVLGYGVKIYPKTTPSSVLRMNKQSDKARAALATDLAEALKVLPDDAGEIDERLASSPHDDMLQAFDHDGKPLYTLLIRGE
jgi:hypothetical protein